MLALIRNHTYSCGFFFILALFNLEHCSYSQYSIIQGFKTYCIKRVEIDSTTDIQNQIILWRSLEKRIITRLDYYLLSTSYASIGNVDSSAKYLSLAADLGLRFSSKDDTSFLLTYPWKLLRSNFTGWNSLKEHIDRNTREYPSKKNCVSDNLELYKSLLYGSGDKDQFLRSHRKKTIDSLGLVDLDSLWKTQITNDEKNQKTLMRIVEDVGWPSSECFSKDERNNAWLIAQHADNDIEFQIYCFHKIIIKWSFSEVLPSQVAYLFDRILLNIGDKQLFGTQFVFRKKEGQLDPKPLNYDFKITNKLRKLFGLPSIESYLAESLNHIKVTK